MAVRNAFHLAPPDWQDREETIDVLFVAGDPDLAELYRIKLELDGYRVAIVTSIEAAVEAVGRQPADIIYLDLGDLTLKAIASWGALRQDPALRNTPMILLVGSGVVPFTRPQGRPGRFDYLIAADAEPATFDDASGGGNRPISTVS
jgi:DNA-binding NtrC family response regulator